MKKVLTYLFGLSCSLILPIPSFADAADEAIEEAMRSCVLQVAPRIGNPAKDDELWAEVVSKVTTFEFSRIEIVGIGSHANLEEALSEETKGTLISELDAMGFRNFRSIIMDTVDECLPKAVAAYVAETKRQENAVCPDMTDYMKSIKILKMSDTELRADYGDLADEVRKSALNLKLEFWSAFPEIFSHGTEDHPSFSKSKFLDLNKYLSNLDLKEISSVRKNVNFAISSIDKVDTPLPERVKSLRTDLQCLLDWIDVYPKEAMATD